MTIESGTRLGPYEVVSRIGEGGMGVVWQARDTRLDRVVAIKVLPVEYAASAQLRMRFEREARVISSLNHPHICTLFDVGEGYLVMELLDGESLADRLRKGPLPLDQVLRYGTQIAQALDAAHRQGIVHRDLKPGNVMLTRSGAKLLDFGLAKNAVFTGSGSGASVIPVAEATEHKPLTTEGTILGTFQYMAPEQLEGTEADARTDIFGLGALLYEMATGKRAFQGHSKTSLIAAIVSSHPAPISTVAPMAPPALDHVVKRCLEKSPEDRWQSAHDVAGELQWISEAGSQAGVAAPLTMRRKARERLAWIAAAAATVAALAIGGYTMVRAPEPVRRMTSAILPPEGIRLPITENSPANAVPSPDGRRLVFLGTDSESRTALYLHDLASGETKTLPETEQAQYPFWSPDSRWIGFFTQLDSALKKIDTAGGPPIRLAAAINGKGGTWSEEGEILFAPDYGSALLAVSAAGGQVREVTKLDLKQHNSHRHPRFLPDGRRFLFLARSIQAGRDNSILLGSLDGDEPREILQSPTHAEYADGHLLFVRGATLMAQPFDPKSGTLEAESRPLANGVVALKGAAFSTVAASREGIVVYHTGTPVALRPLEWRNRKGEVEKTLGDPANYGAAILSPSGRSIAASITIDGETDLALIDSTTGMARRLPSIGEDLQPLWSLDEKSLVYASNPKGRFGLYRRSLDGGERVEPILETADDLFPVHIFPDGVLVLRTESRPSGEDASGLFLLKTGERALTPVIKGTRTAAVSSDSRWIAWCVATREGADLFVAKYPELTERRQLMSGISEFSLFWSDDGRELFYMNRRNDLFVIGRDGEAFDTPRALPVVATPAVDTSRDGENILVLGEPDAPPTSAIRMIQNWTVPAD